jgi:competence protein ComEC
MSQTSAGRVPAAEAQASRARVDLRLATGAAAAWIAVALALGRPPVVSLVGAVLCGIVATVALAARRGRGAGAALALAGFCMAMALLPLSARLERVQVSPLARLAQQRRAVTAELTVTADPRALAAKGPAGMPRTAVDASLRAVIFDGRRVVLGGAVLVLAPAAVWRDVLPGQRVRVDGLLQPPLAGDLLAAVLSAQSDPVPIGRPAWYQRAAGTVRAALRTAAAGLPEGPRGLLPGLVVGDTTGLDPVLAERFRVAGLTHLVAVSGTNCTIVLGACVLVLRRFRCGPRTCAVLGGAVLVMFVIVARPSPSVLRAAVMAAIALVALAAGRRRDGLPMVAAAVLALLVWRPALATDLGFAMSVLATVALLLIAPGWAQALRRRRVPPVVAESLAVAAAAHLVTAPLVVIISGTVSIVAIPANVLAEPVVALTTVLGFAAAVTAPVSLTVGTLFAQVAAWPCRWLVWVAEFFGGLDGARLPWPGGTSGGALLAAVTFALIWLGRRRSSRRALGVALLTGLAVQVPVRSAVAGWPPRGWIFLACDVGQGDGLVLPAGPNAAVVVDAGPDPVAMDRCLRAIGVTQVPLVVLSHYHLDHVGGLSGVFHGRAVSQVLAGPLPEPASGLAVVAAVLRGHGLSAGGVRIGQRIEVGAASLEVLGPLTTYRGTRSDPNNSSLVLRATIAGRRILLPGDAEIEAQDALLSAGTDVHADVLKVPHHGSAYSDAGFLAAVGAQLAVISVGRHNDYGHPSPLLLEALNMLGVSTRRTDQDGDVAVVAQGGTLRAVTRTAAIVASGIPGGAASDDPTARTRGTASAPHVTMSLWLTRPVHVRRPSRAATGIYRPSSCCWVTRSCSSAEPSSRSPPRLVGPIRPPTCVNGKAVNWTAPSCSNC